MLDVSRQGLVGSVLLVVGCLLFVPAAGPAVSGPISATLAAGTLLLAAGTYLIGTDVSGHPA